MQIVIEIPDDVYKEFKAGVQSMKNDCIISNAVFDGKVLPKNHVRLIDVDAIDADTLANFIDHGHLNNPDAKVFSENDILDLINKFQNHTKEI